MLKNLREHIQEKWKQRQLDRQYHVRQIRVLSEDGLEEIGGIYTKMWWDPRAAANGNRFLDPVVDAAEIFDAKGNVVDRNVEQSRLAGFKYRGGIIMLPNSIIPGGENMEAVRNRLTALVTRLLPEEAMFSFGNLFYGKYSRGGKVFDERSYCIGLINTSTELNLALMKELIGASPEEMFVMKDLNEENFYRSCKI